MKTDKKSVLRMMVRVRKIVQAEISDHSTSFYGRGTASEGYAGGYLQALDDMDAMLRHGFPGDPRGYWKKAIKLDNANT